MKKLLDWLLYDKPLFIKENIKPYDKSIRKEYWKKNWLGLTKVYESYDKKYNWCFIRFSSHLAEDDCIEDLRNTITIGWGPYYKKYLLPFSIIKPLLDYHHYEKDSNGKDTDKIKWSVYVERNYEIKIVKDEGYFTFDWNVGSDFLYNITKHKGYELWIWFFWKQCTRCKQELLNLDGSLYKDITNIKNTDTLDRYDIIKSYENSQPCIFFDVLDYDKEEIEVKARLERNTYSYGNTKFTKWLMKFFKKPHIYTSLDLEFNKEVGSRKGSWKGGTMGHAVDLLENEDPIEAFKRYCIDPNIRGSRNNYGTNMTFLGYRIYKDYGITDCLPYKALTLSPFVFGLVDFDNEFIIKEDFGINDYDIPIKFILNKDSKFLNTENKECYYLEDEKHMTTYLFNMYLHKTPIDKREVQSNCINYIFTKEAVDFLKEKDDFMVKYVKFIKI